MIEFFFDCSSPWTYLGFHNVQPLAAEMGVPIRWRPILVGGVFNAVNPSVYASRENPVPAKRDYMLKDLQDWARLSGLRIVMPPNVFPVNSVKAMRGALVALDEGRLVPYARAVFQRYWRDLADISQPDVVAQVAASVGFDGPAFLERIAQPALKERLRRNTEELVARGGFGTPTMFVNGTDMYFGNDRLLLLERAIAADGPRA